jgi:hypothetical protein
MKKAGWWLLIVLFASTLAGAQAQFGEFSLTGAGSLAAGYTASTDDQASQHGLALGGESTISGSYYSPNFANFSIAPFYNESRANSSVSSVTDSTGFNSSLNLFGGSRFPLSISYGRTTDSQNNFNLGAGEFATHGTGDNLALQSDLNFEHLPPLRLMYNQGGTNSDVYGTDQQLDTHYRALLLNTSYQFAGFRLSGGYQVRWTSEVLPDIFTDQSNGFDSVSKTYQASISHVLPWRGSSSINYSHDDYDGDYSTGHNAGSFQSVSANVNVQPTDKLRFNSYANFVDNLAGVLEQTIAGVNGVALFQSPGTRTDALTVNNSVVYTLTDHIGLSGGYSYAQQFLLDVPYRGQSVDGEVHYWRDVWGGRLNTDFGVTETVDGVKETGFRGTGGWGRQFGAWSVNTGFQYNRSQQTAILGYTTSGYSSSLSGSRKVGRFQWSASTSQAKSTFDQQGGGDSTSQNFSSSLSGKFGSLGGGYTRATGFSILTSTGLVASPLPPGVLPAIDSISFNGDSYSASAAFIPYSRLSLSATYSWAQNKNAVEGSSSDQSSNSSAMFNFRLQWSYHKLWFNAGYTKFQQDFSTSTTGAAAFSTYYFGIQRWFNLL